MHYRRIYEIYVGPIPVDENGRTYDIHHIDKNRNNNDPSNLIALSLQDHYNLHWSQGDYGACYGIALRMNASPEEISKRCSELATLMNEERKGQTHHCKGRKHYNNGVIQKMFKDPPEGWVPGRLHFNNKGSKIGAEKQKNKKWYNNGQREGMFKKQPEGWSVGRLFDSKKGKSKPEWSIAVKKGWETRRSKSPS